jgi:hypothetical protein
MQEISVLHEHSAQKHLWTKHMYMYQFLLDYFAIL